MLSVHPTQGRQGYGRMLLDHVEALAKKEGHGTIRLVFVDSNTYLRKMYQTRGYEQTGTHPWTDIMSQKQFESIIVPSCRHCRFVDMELELGNRASK